MTQKEKMKELQERIKFLEKLASDHSREFAAMNSELVGLRLWRDGVLAACGLKQL